MLWIALALVSSFFLGFYDVAKKKSLEDNSVLAVLLLNTVFCSLIFLPLILFSHFAPEKVSGSVFDANLYGTYLSNPAGANVLVFIKSCIVLSSWILGYFALKHLPLTIAGPVNATRPVFVLLGAILFFGERLNVLQWAGVLVSLFSIFLLSRSGKKEGIDFAGNKWILVLFAAALMGAVSGLYDKYIMKMLPPLYVQSRFNIYQAILMGIIVWGMRRKRSSLNHDGKFKWKWSILLISLFISVADFAYFYALSLHGSMISVVSMIRRGSVLVSFTCGALLFKEKNIGSKALDLLLILAGMALLFLGSVI